MANYQLLNNVDHADLRVNTERSAALGDAVMFAVTYPFEFRQVQAHYPIVLFKNPQDSQFYPVALFGLSQGENLFLDQQGWAPTFIPASIQRAPFLIGFQEDPNDPMADTKRVVTVDIEHPRVSKDMGLAVFTDNGGYSDYLQKVSDLLEAIYSGGIQNKALIAALEEHRLLQSMDLDIGLVDGSHAQLSGFYVVDDLALQQLDAQALGQLNQQGLLMPIYMMVASMSQLRALVQRKNQRLA